MSAPQLAAFLEAAVMTAGAGWVLWRLASAPSCAPRSRTGHLTGVRGDHPGPGPVGEVGGGDRDLI